MYALACQNSYNSILLDYLGLTVEDNSYIFSVRWAGVGRIEKMPRSWSQQEY